ncbi:hypothetical protein HPP92_013095 [Vanilla planifolia]|uniref:Uncharacterized protein n=1 Tax=Vanilla planifolia TaxID=51239 RepID=A0A835QPC5_VANPL|nr:hypothetical protein HPP92_013095 [Vanilla planifolia]
MPVKARRCRLQHQRWIVCSHKIFDADFRNNPSKVPGVQKGGAERQLLANPARCSQMDGLLYRSSETLRYGRLLISSAELFFTVLDGESCQGWTPTRRSFRPSASSILGSRFLGAWKRD